MILRVDKSRRMGLDPGTIITGASSLLNILGGNDTAAKEATASQQATTRNWYIGGALVLGAAVLAAVVLRR